MNWHDVMTAVWITMILGTLITVALVEVFK